MKTKVIAIKFPEIAENQLFIKMTSDEMDVLLESKKSTRNQLISNFAKTADEVRLIWFLDELSKRWSEAEKETGVFEDSKTLQELRKILLIFLKYAGDAQLKTFSEKAQNKLFEFFGWHASKDQVIKFCLTARKEQTQAFVQEAEESRIEWFLDELVNLYKENATKATAVFKFTWFCQAAGPKQVIRFSEIANDNMVEFFSIHAWPHQMEEFSMFAKEKQMIAYSRSATQDTLPTFFKNVLLDQLEVFSKHAGRTQIKEFCKSRAIGDSKMKSFSRNAGEEQIKWFIEFALEDKIKMFAEHAGKKQTKWLVKYANQEKQGWFLGTESNNSVSLPALATEESKVSKWSGWIRNIFK